MYILLICIPFVKHIAPIDTEGIKLFQGEQPRGVTRQAYFAPGLEFIERVKRKVVFRTHQRYVETQRFGTLKLKRMQARAVFIAGAFDIDEEKEHEPGGKQKGREERGDEQTGIFC